MNTNDNMRLIEDMLLAAKKEVKENGVFFMLWGWLVFIAAAGEAFIEYNHWSDNLWHVSSSVSSGIGGITWMILMPLGGVLSIILARKQRRNERVRTWFDDVMKYLWTGFGAALGITLFMMGYANVNLYPVVMGIYGLALFVTGGLLKFNPLKWGGVANWVLAIAAIFAGGIYTTLMLALAVLIGYIIPGHILQKQFKNQEHVQTA
jgi:hypothetical protein